MCGLNPDHLRQFAEGVKLCACHGKSSPRPLVASDADVFESHGAEAD